MVQSVPSAGLQAAQNKECQRYQMLKLLCRGTPTGWRYLMAYRKHTKLSRWKWQVLPQGRKDSGTDQQESGFVEKDLVIPADAVLSSVQRCNPVAKKAWGILGWIRQCWQQVILSLHLVLVRHTKSAVLCWAPWYNKDAHILHQVQHRSTKIIMETRTFWKPSK